MTNKPQRPPQAEPIPPREVWSREVFAIAETLHRTGRQNLVREITIVLPVDYKAVEAIELACRALAGGDFSDGARDLDRFFDKLEREPGMADQFLPSLQSVVRRLGFSENGV
ncbi:MAG TPA: hypothetical protein VKD71_07845 [Gemmataceae bacterium]|nr:hypothetical protein [Gemmataceae bacterium]